MSRIRDIASILTTASTLSTDAEVTAAIAAHISATDPHGDRAATSLPSQTGNSNKYLTTDGNNASWGIISFDTTSIEIGTVMGAY